LGAVPQRRSVARGAQHLALWHARQALQNRAKPRIIDMALIAHLDAAWKAARADATLYRSMGVEGTALSESMAASAKQKGREAEKASKENNGCLGGVINIVRRVASAHSRKHKAHCGGGADNVIIIGRRAAN